ncbi:MAG TPA: SPW repeat protein [Thermomicrobiales bacterium]|nr:SPW repeat protein [Thermomicrobiales bacterium]
MTRLPTRIHGIVDYIAGIILIASPWLFGFNDHRTATLVGLLGGLAIVILAGITMDELGIWKILPITSHLPLEALIGLALATSPLVLGFSGTAWIPFVIIGIGLLLMDAFTERVAGGGIKRFVQVAHRERESPGEARRQFQRRLKERERLARHPQGPQRLT